MNHDFSRYKTKPFEAALKDSFSASMQPLFGGRYKNSPVKTAVISTSDTYERPILLSNCNRSHAEDARLPYSFERAEIPANELQVWEAARATSAAPSYFKPLRNVRSGQGYVDGALYHNNPVRVAEIERRLLWPQTSSLPADILLSIGTGCVNPHMTVTPPNFGNSSAFGMKWSADKLTGRSFTRKREKGSMLKAMKNRVDNILDTESIWAQFLSDMSRGDSEDRRRYRRINPSIPGGPPRLDETSKLPQLRELMAQRLKDDEAYQKQVQQVAYQLVASCFYLEVQSLPAGLQELHGFITVKIRCRFLSDSLFIRNLGEYLKNVTTGHFQPFFTAGEKDTDFDAQKIIISLEVIQRMLMNATFELDELHLSISNEAAVTFVNLTLCEGDHYPISGLPRPLMARRPDNTMVSPSSSLPKLKSKTKAKYSSFGDEIDSESKAMFKLQQLPREAKTSLKTFIQENEDRLAQKGEEVPLKMRLLASALDDVEDQPDKSSDSQSPYGTIMHTAAVIGNHLIIEMLLKSGTGFAAPDHYRWTPLMIAKAQGHVDCVKLLSDHVNQLDVRNLDAPFPPSCLVASEPTTSWKFTEDNMQVRPTKWQAQIRQVIQIRSNHPIPPHYKSFYYEMKIVNSGVGCVVGLGFCRPEADVFGMPGFTKTSWGYHSDDGMKHNEKSSRYSCVYQTNDIVGCGINKRTGKVFFTLNGWNQGVAFTNVKGMLFSMIGLADSEAEVSVNFGDTQFLYDIGNHDWVTEETAASISAKPPELKIAAQFEQKKWKEHRII